MNSLQADCKIQSTGNRLGLVRQETQWIIRTGAEVAFLTFGEIGSPQRRKGGKEIAKRGFEYFTPLAATLLSHAHSWPYVGTLLADNSSDSTLRARPTLGRAGVATRSAAGEVHCWRDHADCRAAWCLGRVARGGGAGAFICHVKGRRARDRGPAGRVVSSIHPWRAGPIRFAAFESAVPTGLGVIC
jgi:hypothetical protein